MNVHQKRLDYFEALKFVLIDALIIIPSIFWSFIKFILPKKRKDVTGQLALITGGSEGIGREIVIRLAEKGCNIAIANRNIDNGQKVADGIRKKFNVEARAFKCDVGNREDVKRLKREVNETLGVVDILVNNAGIMPTKNSLLEGDDEFYQYCVDVNVTSWIWTTRAFLPDMIKQKRGHIVGTSSIIVNSSYFNIVTYATTKYANKGFMDALREELIFHGFDKYIKTSTIYPPYVETASDMADIFNKYINPLIIPSASAEYVGRKAVDGILTNQHSIYPDLLGAALLYSADIGPRNVKNLAMKAMLRTKTSEEYHRMRYNDLKL